MSPRSDFTTTDWGTVLAARETSTDASRAALEILCRAYWYPMYAFIRRQGFDADDASDLTQDYFARLLEKGYLDDYDPARGRLRVFLKASIRNFLSKERAKERSWKRGGRTDILSIDQEALEGRYRIEPIDDMTPERFFERRWALTVLETARARLRSERETAGRGREFSRLEDFLTGQRDAPTRYREIATDLGTTEDAVKTAVHRLRRRFGELLRDVVGATVASPKEVDEELRYLIAAMAP